ncbi:MAG: hypothetical protein ACI30R_00880, partial [Sodaliphilus sp.]
MKKLLRTILGITVALFVALGANCKSNERQPNSSNPNATNMEKILFVNGSPNRDGNTAALAK